MVRVRRTVLPTIGLLCVLSGCGPQSSTGQAPVQPRTVTTPDAAATVTILQPLNGDVVDLERPGSTAAPQLTVTGRAPARTRVAITVSCAPTPCRKTVTTTDAGTWRAPMTLRLAAGTTTLSIAATDADPASTDADTIALVLLSPATTAQLRNSTDPSKPARPKRQRARKPPVRPSPDGGPPAASTTQTPAVPPITPAPVQRAGGPFALIGDSLAEGIAPYLPGELGVTRIPTDARIGRSLAEGMTLVRQVNPGSRLAVSLFSNDDPRATAALERAVKESVRVVGSDGCVAWATIHAPAVAGVTYDAANTALRRLATDPALRGVLRLVDWDRAVQNTPAWLAPDRVHATPAGYRARAAMYAQAITSC